MMKKQKLAAFLLLSLSSLVYSQNTDNKVGIQTETPKETLHVDGTVRVDHLPDKEGFVYDGKANAEKQFESAKIVTANEDGVLGSIALPKVLVGADGIDALETNYFSTTYYTTFNSTTKEKDVRNMKTINFTIEHKSIVNFNMLFSIGAIKGKGGIDTGIRDGLVKRMGVGVELNYPDGTEKFIMQDYMTYSQYKADQYDFDSIGGTFYVSGSTSLVLEKGNYSVDVYGVGYSYHPQQGSAGGSGIEFTIGHADNDTLNIIAYPTE